MPEDVHAPRRRSSKEVPVRKESDPTKIAVAPAVTKQILRNMEMHCSSFDKRDLSGSTFFGSRLVRASFRASRLVDVDFTNAKLLFADFEGANLSGAILKDASVRGARFVRVSGLSKEALEGLKRRGAIIRAPRAVRAQPPLLEKSP